MRKISIFLATTCVLVMLSGNAFAWSDRSEGQPNRSYLTNMSGLSVWHDRNDELHLRATNLGRQHVFSGIIQTDGYFYNIEEKQLENGDHVTIDRDHNTIRFRFTGRGIDALDFKVRGGDTVDFDLYKDGKAISTKEIYIGKRGWHPWHNNFYLER